MADQIDNILQSKKHNPRNEPSPFILTLSTNVNLRSKKFFRSIMWEDHSVSKARYIHRAQLRTGKKLLL